MPVFMTVSPEYDRYAYMQFQKDALGSSCVDRLIARERIRLEKKKILCISMVFPGPTHKVPKGRPFCRRKLEHLLYLKGF